MKDANTGSTTMDSNMLIGPPKCDYIKSKFFILQKLLKIYNALKTNQPAN